MKATLRASWNESLEEVCTCVCVHNCMHVHVCKCIFTCILEILKSLIHTFTCIHLNMYMYMQASERRSLKAKMEGIRQELRLANTAVTEVYIHINKFYCVCHLTIIEFITLCLH